MDLDVTPAPLPLAPSERATSMEDLPEQALIGMMHMLEPNDLAALACACRRLHSISLMVDGKDGKLVEPVCCARI